MEIAGAVVVVTGGASGIGKALAERFIADGARGVVIADQDGANATELAHSLGRSARGIRCDASDPADIAASIALASHAFGPVDLFCANAGVAVGLDEQSDDAVWAHAFDVNVRAHVIAARQLVPLWLERRSGYFLSTASAAGLLTQIGSAPYAVSKHAAVGFAEWLSVTYGDRGIRVSCLCPMGVDTPLLRGDGPSGSGIAHSAAASVLAAGPVISPAEVASIVIRGLVDERFLILPHPEVLEFVRRKYDNPERWLAGMRRLQRQVTLTESPYRRGEGPGHAGRGNA